MSKEQDQQVAQSEQEVPSTTEQEKTDTSHDVGELIAESKSYRKRAQQNETRVKELETQLKSIEDQKLKDKEQWKELAEKREKTIADLTVRAEKGDSLESALRTEAMESLSEEDREFAEEMSTEKLLKFAKRSIKVPVSTNESAVGVTVPPDKNPFTEMTKDERRKNWGRILESYRGKSKN